MVGCPLYRKEPKERGLLNQPCCRGQSPKHELVGNIWDSDLFKHEDICKGISSTGRIASLSLFGLDEQRQRSHLKGICSGSDIDSLLPTESARSKRIYTEFINFP
ncbi:cytoplasmic dynein heavy chain [Planoprotostelium fungivorum]|uniref:Cytoplasmic dynein heavy chain n=1 Tax=Planoprotostelium fungivorum TaxID=1890364 RepID=A0A2P6MW48_9EUKA|nr:cytoplasmic dynein heavy chain [Planoprotostelium fungivorum]